MSFATQLYFLWACLFIQELLALRVQNDKPSGANAVGEHIMPKHNILLLGSSVDRFALHFFCESRQAELQSDSIFSEPPSPLNGASFCSIGDVTMAYMFHPGAGRTPYWPAFKPAGGSHSQHKLTKDIILLDAPNFAERIFGSAPNLIVVDSSLWELSKWWKYPDTNPGIQEWCLHEIPEFLGWVSVAFPDSRIAFRTAPTVRKPAKGQDEHIIHTMREGIMNQISKSRLYGKYELIDYHALTDKVIERHGGKKEEVFLDQNHPGREASLLYINETLKMAQASPILENDEGSNERLKAIEQIMKRMGSEFTLSV